MLPPSGTKGDCSVYITTVELPQVSSGTHLTTNPQEIVNICVELVVIVPRP